MSSDAYVFDRFTLDVANRTLWRDGDPVEISARYLDALILLVSEAGQLITKDRFHQDVWRGVPVTDEALTQCVKTLRRQLGDDAARPRFIVTVPKYGYRFVAPAERSTAVPGPREAPAVAVDPRGSGAQPMREFLALGAAGTLGAAAAGAAGGLVYGSLLAAQPLEPGASGVSVLLVLLWLTIMAAAVGGAGVSFGIAAAGAARSPAWRVVGGAAGGMLVGGVVKLLGLDAFSLLLGRSPGDITGALEGLALGGSVGLAACLSDRGTGESLRRGVAIAAAVGGAGAAAIIALGGTLMAGSLDLLARSFPGSRIALAPIGRMFGEAGFGPLAQLATGALEGALFAACIIAARGLARRRLSR